MLKAKLSFLIGLLAVVGLTGCGASTDYPATVPVSGTVTHNGAAVAGAVVSFSPQSEGGNAAAGVTDPQGNFSLTTFNPGDGAVPGNYAVTVSKKAGRAQLAATESSSEDPSADYIAAEEAGLDPTGAGGGDPTMTTPAEDLLPAKYSNRDTSGLTAEVTEGGDNNFSFALTD